MPHFTEGQPALFAGKAIPFQRANKDERIAEVRRGVKWTRCSTASFVCGHDLKTRSLNETKPQDVAPMVLYLQRRLSCKRIMDLLYCTYIMVDNSASSYSPVHLITQCQRSWMFYNHLKGNIMLLFQCNEHQSGAITQQHLRALFTFNIYWVWLGKKTISEIDKDPVYTGFSYIQRQII